MRGAFLVNGRASEWAFETDATLLDVLRANGHPEVHRGCDEGVCGSCAILLDGRLVNSCQVLAASAMEKSILTIVGVGTVHEPHPLQTAFVESGAIQCGFCTPATILAALSLLRKNPNPTDEEICSALDGNYCRCTGYVKIIKAVRLASRRMSAHD